MEQAVDGPSSEKKVKHFCGYTFREELKQSEVLKSLRRFTSAAKSSDEDVVLEYMESGGSSFEILSLIDITAKGDLTTAFPVFKVLHLILLRFQSPDSKFHQDCFEGAKSILRSHLLTIRQMLSMNSSKHRIVALKLLTAIVTLHSSFASEILNVMTLSSTQINDFIQPSPEKESVRKYFIMFVLSFIVGGNVTAVRNLIDKKGYISSIIPGLKFDDPETVNMTLSLLKDKILTNGAVQKTLKLKIFNTQVIKSLFDLYDWKGPKGIKQFLPKKRKLKEVDIVNQQEKDLVIDSVHSFLLLLCSSKKYGVVFSDKSLGTSDKMNNQLLFTVIENLSDPLTNKKVAEIILKTLISCPDLVKPTLMKLESFFQPRDSKNWFEAIDFAENLIKTLNCSSVIKNESGSLNVNQIVQVAKTLCTPVVFLKNAKFGAEKSQPIEVRLRSLGLLSTIWIETQKLINCFPTNEVKELDLKKSLTMLISKYLPDAADLVDLWHSLCDEEFILNSSISDEQIFPFLGIVLNSVQMIIHCQRSVITSPLNLVSDLLRNLKLIKNKMSNSESTEIQLKVVQLISVDLQALTPDMELFEESLLILLKICDDSSLSCASKILISTGVLESSNAEIDVWLASYISLSLENRIPVAESLILSIRRLYNESFQHRNEIPLQIEDSQMSEFLTCEPGNSVEVMNEKSLTPLIFHCIEILKEYSSDLSKHSESFTAFQIYLSDVIPHLQHFYANEVFLYDEFKTFRQVLNKSVINYLKGWSKNSLTESSDFSIFLYPLQKNLLNWLLNENDRRNIEEFYSSESISLLESYTLFRTILAYFINKVTSQDLNEYNMEKFVNGMLFFTKGNLTDVGSFDNNCFVSYDLKNTDVYQKNCISSILLNKSLLDGFDIFNKKNQNVSHCSNVLIRVLMKNELITSNLSFVKNLSAPWKTRFLKQLKSKLKKNKPVDNIRNLETVLNFFRYAPADIEEIVNSLLFAPDFNVFISKGEPSKWTFILTKFVRLYCNEKNLDSEDFKKLCNLMTYLTERGCISLEVLDNCFVHVIRKHPKNLLLIENEFLKAILKRPNVTTALTTLGKLLLNDPNKVKYFLTFATENLNVIKEPKFLFSLLSVLIINKNKFIDILKKEEKCFLWNTDEVDKNNSSELYNMLEIVYKKFEDNILSAMMGKQEDFVSENLEVTCLLVKLFIEIKSMKKIKKKICEGKFQPDLLHAAVIKLNVKEISEMYSKGILALFCGIIKKSEDTDQVNLWPKYCCLVTDLIEQSEDLSKENIISSYEWKEFVKLAIGFCLSSSKHPSLLKILRLLITALYQNDKASKDTALFFQMLISHSKFLNTILSGSPLKSELAELLFALVERSSSEMSSKHIPIFLASYTGSLSSSDKILLKLINFYEKSGIDITEYEPFVWGNAAISHYSIGTNPGLSLWQRFTMANVLDLLDPEKMDNSLKEFPIYRTFKLSETSKVVDDVNVYDPAFLLPLFVNLLSPGSIVSCLPFVYKGALGYTFRSLSSTCCEIRIIASVVLNRFYNHLEFSQNLKQKLVWMHFINCFRYGIEDLSTQSLPNIVSLFFARMTLELTRHPAEMYLPLQNFLLAKSYFSFDSVPEFLPLFHSSEVSFKKHREWLVEVMKDGIKTTGDLSIIFRGSVLKVIFCFFQSQLCDKEMKKLILQLLERMLRVEKGLLLVSEYGLLNWINSTDSSSLQIIINDLLKLLSTLSNAIVKDIEIHECKYTNRSHIIQILNIVIKLLPFVKNSKSVEILDLCLNVIFSSSVLFVENEQSEWFILNKNRLNEIIETGCSILGEKYNYNKLSEFPFYFRDFENEWKSETMQKFTNTMVLFEILVNKKTK